MKKIGTPDEVAATLDFRHGTDVALVRLSAVAQPWNGRGVTPASQRLVVPSVTDRDLRISMIYTYDTGTHESGWWKNSEYNACKHLSMVGMADGGYAKVPPIDLAAWARVWFGEDFRKAWNEPPADHFDEYRDAPASAFTNHVRVFVDQEMNTIIPEGEVYTLKPFEDGSSPDKIVR